MTVKSPKSIAIIGAGPGGLVSVNEYLNTKLEDGTPAFDKVVAFEQKGSVGGVWVYSDEPDVVEDDLIKSQYWNADTVHPEIKAPEGVENHTVDNPLETAPADNAHQWRRSGVYPNLYTNVSRRFLRFSSIPYTPGKERDVIGPLITHEDVNEVLETFADEHKLKEHIRLNTQVQDVRKDGDQWVLTLRKTGGDKDEWYTESFDAVAVASGHYSTPYIPYIKGLDTRAKGSVSHAKSYRTAEPFKDKTVLIVGSSLSGVDIAQYIDPIAKVVFSRTPGKEEIYKWITTAAEKADTRPRIKEVNGDLVTFVDGTQLVVDHIIFATGYHWRWPFLNDKLIQQTKPGYEGTTTSASRVKDLYWNIFNIEDPTLAFIGVTIGTTKFHSLEAAAAATAGIWSGSKQLPSKEEQYKWIQDRIAETGDNLFFHYYEYHTIKEKWFDPVIEKFAQDGRVNPLEGEDITDLDRGLESAEKTYYGVKNRDPIYNSLH